MRVKILLALSLLAAAGTGDGRILFCVAMLCHLGLLISGIGCLNAWKKLGSFKGFFLVLGVAPVFLTPGTPLDLLGEVHLPITREGLECGALAVSRLALMVWVSMILICTTRFEAIMETVSATSSRKFPGGNILREMILVGVLAFKALPGLLAEAETRMGNLPDREKCGSISHRLRQVRDAVRAMMAWTVTALSDPECMIGREKSR
ncbi:hypothetical protein UZ36_06255 [Candidatus Nitromaritima sp. SCGC AAA799-C22]|nr:hypothetical protein UZ36_06255 [Candidatus Nitromaritima sp. SCGC AAA799-C22]